MADQTDNSPSSKGVQFKDDAVDKPYPMKHVPTQRYDRKGDPEEIRSGKLDGRPTKGALQWRRGLYKLYS